MIFWISMWLLIGLVTVLVGEALDYLFDMWRSSNGSEDYVVNVEGVAWFLLGVVLGFISTVLMTVALVQIAYRKLMPKISWNREFFRTKMRPYR